MIRINLIKSQVPTHIDLPKRKRSYKSILKILIIIPFLSVLAVFLVYFVFIKGSEKIVVQNPVQHTVKTRIIHKIIKEPKKEKAKSETKKSVSKHKTTVLNKNNHLKEAKKIVARKDNGTQNKKVGNKTHKNIEHKNKEKMMAELKKTVFPVFSLNIKLNKIPKPIVSSASKTQKKLYREIVSDNITGKNAQKKENKIKKPAMLSVKIKTRSVYLLKKYLKKMNIKYRLRKIVYKTYATYDIFVGGFDSYPKIVKFSKDLKSKGYNLYKIENINLLFYVCIDRNVDKKIMKRYVEVWSKTPFRILTRKRKKRDYAYIFEFQCFKRQLNILKKKGYYPIIMQHPKGGA